MVIKSLDGSSCKKCIISTSATYIWHTHEKVKKKWANSRKWNWPIIVSRNTYQFNLWRSLQVYIKAVSSKLSFKAIKIALESKKYGLCKHRINNTEINRNMGQNVQFWKHRVIGTQNNHLEKSSNFENFSTPHTKRENENVQIEMCHKLILQNIIET